MKKKALLLVFLFVFFSSNLYCQFDSTIINNEVYIDMKGGCVEGLPYILTLNASEYYDSLVVKGDENVLIISEFNCYKLVFHGFPYKSIISVYGWKDGIATKIQSEKILFFPAPYQAYLAVLEVGPIFRYSSVDKNKLHGAILKAEMINFINNTQQTKSFSISYRDSLGHWKLLPYEGESVIDDKLFSMIQNLPFGTALKFDFIEIESLYGFPIKVDPLVIFLK